MGFRVSEGSWSILEGFRVKFVFCSGWPGLRKSMQIAFPSRHGFDISTQTPNGSTFLRSFSFFSHGARSLQGKPNKVP